MLLHKLFSSLHKQKHRTRPAKVSAMDSCGSSYTAQALLQPTISAENTRQEMESVNRMKSFIIRLFCCCRRVDPAAATITDANVTAPPSAAATIAFNRHADEIYCLFGALSRKEARAMYRMVFLTASQWAIVMETCGVRMESDASSVDMLKEMMEWRRERGDFDRHADNDDDVEEEEQETGSGCDVEVPRLSDDMQEANEAILEMGFLKTDLQVECLQRGLSYRGGDTKAQLISKLMHHKRLLCLNTLRSSFQVLAEQST